ncbi:MAG TPA: hypothetical protein VFI99_04910 [Nocardioides sp.]|jgi:hypothetical protein|nr:hypothetical protein [Nocardioides sp.]
MNVRPLARVCGLLGGLCWVARWVLGGGTVGDVLQWAGLVLLFVGLFGLGTALVNKGEVWLQVIVGVAFPLLVWSVVEVLHASGDPVVIDAVVGVMIAATCVLALGPRGEGGQRPPRRHAGAHAR